MAQTVIPFGHALAQKVYGGAVFAEVSRKRTFSTSMTGPAPTQGEARNRLRKEQTPSDYPFVRVTDLSKGYGDTVQATLVNIITGMPVMGDKPMEDKLLSLELGTMETKIDQMRFGVDSGGAMTRQRTSVDLRTLGRAAIEGLWGRAQDQIALVHCAGARGDQNTIDWVVPPESHPQFNEIVVNKVRAPSHNRHFYGGDATKISELDVTDILTLETIDMLRAAIDEMDQPMQPVMLPDDPAKEEKALYVLWITSRQWAHLQSHTNTTSATGWRTFMSNAQSRGSKNPLFTGEAGMWNGILIKTMSRAIRFNQGSSVRVTTSANAYTEATETVPIFNAVQTEKGLHGIDRAILLGAQGLIQAWGADSDSMMPMKWVEKRLDFDNRYGAVVSGMGGTQKISFKDGNGAWTDHGIAVVDSYAPDPRTTRIA